MRIRNSTAEVAEMGSRTGGQDDMRPLHLGELTGDERELFARGRSLAELAVRRQVAAHTRRVADLVACAVAGMQSGMDVHAICERLVVEPDPVLGAPVGCDGLLDVLTPLLVGVWGRRRLGPDAFADAVITDAAAVRLAGGGGPLVDADAVVVKRAAELCAGLVRYAAAGVGLFGFSPAELSALGCSEHDPRALLLAHEFTAQCCPAGADAASSIEEWADARGEDLVDALAAGVLLACWAERALIAGSAG
jgi:hypothetical protein